MSIRLAEQSATSYESGEKLSSGSRSADVLESIEQRLRDKVGRKIHELRLQVENPNRPKRLSATEMPIITERLSELPVCTSTAATQRRSSNYQSVMMTSFPFTSRCRSSMIITDSQHSAAAMTSCSECLTRSSSSDGDFKTSTTSRRHTAPVLQPFPVHTSPNDGEMNCSKYRPTSPRDRVNNCVDDHVVLRKNKSAARCDNRFVGGKIRAPDASETNESCSNSLSSEDVQRKEGLRSWSSDDSDEIIRHQQKQVHAQSKELPDYLVVNDSSGNGDKHVVNKSPSIVGELVSTTTYYPQQCSLLSSARLVADYANTVKMFNTECRDLRHRSDPDDVTDAAVMCDDVERTMADTDDVIVDRTMEVTIEKGVLGLGFCVDGGTDAPAGPAPISVKRLFKGETASKGRLQAGDEIVSVNGYSFIEITHFDAWKVLKKLPDGLVRFVIRRKPNEIE